MGDVITVFNLIQMAGIALIGYLALREKANRGEWQQQIDVKIAEFKREFADKYVPISVDAIEGRRIEDKLGNLVDEVKRMRDNIHTANTTNTNLYANVQQRLLNLEGSHSDKVRRMTAIELEQVEIRKDIRELMQVLARRSHD